MKCKYPKSVCGNMTVLNGVAYCDSVPCSLRAEIPSVTNADRLRELAQADKERRCVVLPCKVGDTVFIVEKDEIKEMEVDHVRIVLDGAICIHGSCKDRSDYCFCNGICGINFSPENMQQRNVHLTREEAETALRREQDE